MWHRKIGEKKQVFFAVSFSGKVDAEKRVLPEHRRNMEETIDLARRLGLNVFCALEHDDWQRWGNFCNSICSELLLV